MMWNNDIRSDFSFHFSASNEESVSVNFKAVSVEQILTKFEDFLHGCGYKLSGQLQIVGEENTSAKQYAPSQNPFPTSGGITKEQIAALSPISIKPLTPQDIKLQAPNKNEDILHFGV